MLGFFEVKGPRRKRKRMTPDKSLVLDYYNGAQAAKYLGLNVHLLWKMRNCTGGVPEYFTKGQREFYTKRALDTWAEENLK